MMCSQFKKADIYKFMNLQVYEEVYTWLKARIRN